MSKIHVTCQCGSQFMARADLAGRTVACPKCQAAIQVPLPGSAAPLPSNPLPQRRRQGSNTNLPLGLTPARLAIVAIAVVAIVVVAITVTFLTGRDKPADDDSTLVLPDGRLISEIETKEPARDWTFRWAGQEERTVRGKLRRVSSTGVTVLGPTGVVGGRFEYVSENDKVYLREYLNRKKFVVPTELRPAQARAMESQARSGKKSRLLTTTGDQLPPLDPGPAPVFGLSAGPLTIGSGDDFLMHGGEQPTVAIVNRSIREHVLEFYDLATGQVTRQYPLPRGELLAVSPDGQRAIVKKASTGNTLIAYRLDDPVVAEAEWEPTKAKVESVVFVDDDHFLTRTPYEGHICWRWPKQRLYVNDISGVHALSPGRKQYVETLDNGLQFRDSLSGKPIGRLHLSDSFRVASASYSPDGNFLAAVFQPLGSSKEEFIVWDLATGQRKFRCPTFGSRGKNVWFGNTYLAVGTLLVDVGANACLWQFKSMTPGIVGPDQRLWCKPPYQKVLTPYEVPSPELMKQVAKLGRAEQLAAAGAQVTLEWSIPEKAQGADRREIFREVIEQKIHEAGWQIAPGQKNRLKVLVRDIDSSEMITLGHYNVYKSRTGHVTQRPTGRTLEVPNRVLEYEISLVGMDGNAVPLAKFDTQFSKVLLSKPTLTPDITVDGCLELRWDTLIRHAEQKIKFSTPVWSSTSLGKGGRPDAPAAR